MTLTQQIYDDHTARAIDCAEEYFDVHGKLPSHVYVTVRSWIQMVEGTMRYTPNHNHSLFEINLRTRNGYVGVKISYDLPRDTLPMNPDEYQRWLDEEFEKAVLL